MRQPADLARAFTLGPIDGVVHFAGLKAVAESLADPLRYWDVNVGGSQALLAAMRTHGCRVILFSSTSTVYGQPERFPLLESAALNPLHPYAQTKLAVEQVLTALPASEPGWRVSSLRYFNPVGAHPSGRIEEDPRGIPYTPTTCSRSSPRWRRAARAGCACSAATTPLWLAPASAVTCT